MTSREGKEKRIPGVPIEMPSLTPMVLKIKPTISCSGMPFFICVDKSLRCILHGFPSYPVLAIPIKGFWKSSSVRPMACNIACAAGWVGSCVTRWLYLVSLLIVIYEIKCSAQNRPNPSLFCIISNSYIIGIKHCKTAFC